MEDPNYSLLVRTATPDEAGTFVHFDRALRTRNICILALFCSFFLGVGSIIYGILILTQNKPYVYAVLSQSASPNVSECVKLAITLVVTLLLDSTGYIHATSLRWALNHEGRLTFNSNLRMLTASTMSGPNRWYCNFIMILCTVFAYACGSLTVWTYPNVEYGGAIDGLVIAIGGIPTLCLGISLIVISAISLWSLKKTFIPTWSSSPLHTALAMLQSGHVKRRENRCMLGVHDKLEQAHAVRPRRWQRPIITVRPAIRFILAPCFLIILIVLAIFIILFQSGGELGFGWAIVNKYGVGNLAGTNNPAGNAFIVLLFFAATQAPFTLMLHSAELVVNLSRDERYWRKASSRKGCRLKDYDSTWAAVSSWQSAILFLFKGILHWVFALAIVQRGGDVQSEYYEYGLGFLGNGFLAILGVSTACAVFITTVACRRPKGPQPAAYGHVQTLVDLIDEWYPVMYWGDKAEGKVGLPCHAGTSFHRLRPVRMDEVYGEERASLDHYGRRA